MIPLKLQIKNFLSYGAPTTIDFTPYNLICLSGKNGHGKSALLDAMTWAVWGQARKVGGQGKADEGLLRLGQTHMMVVLDFLCNDILYRIKREYTVKANKTQGSLEFGIIEKEGIKALTDKTIRATQNKIETILGLDFDSFVNSAFIRQGQSHEFSKKTPKERKEILATILGLDHFENMRKLAIEKAKAAQTLKDQSSLLLQQLEEEIKQKPRIDELHKASTANLALITTKEKELQAKAASFATKVKTLTSAKTEAEKVAFQKEHLEKRLAHELKTLHEQRKAWRAVLKKRKPIVDVEKERVVVANELKELHIKAAKKIELKEAHMVQTASLTTYVKEQEEAITKQRDAKEKEMHTIIVALKTSQEKVEELTKKATLLAQEIQKIDDEKKGLEKESTATSLDLLTKREAQIERGKAYYHRFTTKGQSLRSELDALNHKKQLIDTGEHARCPLCEQVADRQALHKKVAKEEHLIHHQMKRLTKVCTSLKEKLIMEHKEWEQLKKDSETYKVNQVRITELDKHHTKLSEELTNLSKAIREEQTRSKNLQDQKATAEKVLATIKLPEKDPHTQKITAAIHLLEKEITALTYDPAREKQLHTQLEQLSKVASEQASYMQEHAQQQERKRLVLAACSTARELKKEIATLKVVTHTPQDEQRLQHEEVQLNIQLSQLTKQKEQLLHQKGALEAQQITLKEKERQYKLEQASLKKQQEVIDEYGTIASAFSKDGIQALLIEDALPEIEQEANTLLARLTDNQAHISIESLKDLKSGKVKETLDIKISDAVGVRPYELFSGGEAFRIDFALRIAISKLLARRAGTALQTLIIDEGFGSQDDDGLSNIMEALYAIQGDFAKIIIVSHLPSMKEQFPVHFVINKGSQGSYVTVVEHC